MDHPLAQEDRRISNPTEILEVRVDRVHPERFQVDVSSVYSRRFFDGVSVASPYLHMDGGSGASFMPREGAIAKLVVPSDGSPPCILAFIPPYRPPTAAPTTSTAAKTEEEEAREKMSDPSKGRFDGNREAMARNDMQILGSEGQGLRVLDGGVVEIGARPLSFTQHTVEGGRRSVERTGKLLWPGGLHTRGQRLKAGIRHFVETWVFRRKIGDAHGLLRLQVGGSGLGEPDKPKDSMAQAAARANVALDQDADPVVLELAGSPEGFLTETGVPTAQARKLSFFRLVLTLGGSLCLRLARSLVVFLQDTLRVEAQTLQLKAKTLGLEITGDASLQSKGSLELGAAQVSFNGGKRGVIAQGDVVQVLIPTGTILTGVLSPPTPAGQAYVATVTVPIQCVGTLVSPGSPSVRVP
jgi:hypothetical protein